MGKSGAGLQGAGDGADGEGTSASKGERPPKDGGLEAWRQRRNDRDPRPVEKGTTAGRIKSLKDGYRCCVRFHLSVTAGSWVGTASAGADAGARYVKRREEDVNALISSLNKRSGSLSAVCS